jgi:site-specific DNA-methyltransferase (adenine-specific)
MNIDTKVYRKHETPTFGNTLLGAVPLVSEVYLMDNIELMKHYPDKYFDLAVVDPPYGINADKKQDKIAGQKGHHKTSGRYKKYHETDWDSEIPQMEYFTELFRVSKNQIIWGGNYFIELPITGVIVWDKGKSIYDNDGELALTSFGGFRIFRMSRADAYINKCDNKIHPTQKPTELYDYCFSKFSKEGDKILDTHLGSGSSRISANKNKLHFVGCEIDEEYFNKQNKRYENFVSQARLW